MRALLYLISGIIFGLGLSLSGMIDPVKVKGFLSIGFSDWDPSLLFVLGSAAPAYLGCFLYLRKRKKTWNGESFAHPKSRGITKQLVVGSILFGLGWGIAGICPGPALVHLAFLDGDYALFIATMFIGFALKGSDYVVGDGAPSALPHHE